MCCDSHQFSYPSLSLPNELFCGHRTAPVFLFSVPVTDDHEDGAQSITSAIMVEHILNNGEPGIFNICIFRRNMPCHAILPTPLCFIAHLSFVLYLPLHDACWQALPGVVCCIMYYLQVILCYTMLCLVLPSMRPFIIHSFSMCLIIYHHPQYHVLVINC